MPKLNSVLADRQQEFDETEKAQARSNIGAAAAEDAGIKSVSHDNSLTGLGNSVSNLGVANYDNLATKTWVNQQGYITAQGAELTAGRGIAINDHVISAPSAVEMNYPLSMPDGTRIDRPVTSLVQYPYKGAVQALQQTTTDGPVDTLYAFKGVPLLDGVYGLDSSGTWKQVMAGMPDDITARKVTVLDSGPDFTTTATIDGVGFRMTGEGIDEDQKPYTNYVGITDQDIWIRKGGELYSLTGGTKTDATLTGDGKSKPLGLTEDVNHRGSMKWVNAMTRENGFYIKVGNSTTTALYTSTHPMSGMYRLRWGAEGISTALWGTHFFHGISVGPDWGMANTTSNVAFVDYPWYTRADQTYGHNTVEVIRDSRLVYLTGQTSINISMQICSGWTTSLAWVPQQVNGDWTNQVGYHGNEPYLANVWCTLDKIGPYAGDRSCMYENR